MATLLMQFVAPMQAWGTQSRFGNRDTGLEPSKSGVVGIMGAALGRPRNADIRDLADLRMAVRIDREGTMQRDFHTAGVDGYMKIGGGIERGSVMLSDRYYLADAVFLVGVEGDRRLLEQVHHALQQPVFPLFLGRKAFPPARPLWLPDGLRDGDLETALRLFPPLVELETGRRRLRVVIDDVHGGALRQDYPLSFAQRRFLPRPVHITFVDVDPATEISEED